MRITIKLFATLRIGREKIILKDYPHGTLIKDIIDDLNIHEQDIAILLRNGITAKLSDEAMDSDTLSLFPPVGGG